MEMKPHAADGLLHLLLLAAGAPMITAGRTKMDDPKHIGPHDGKFEQQKKKKISILYFVWFIVDSHWDTAKKNKKENSQWQNSALRDIMILHNGVNLFSLDLF